MILIATCNDYPHPTPNLAALLKALESLGLSATHHPWKQTAPKVFADAEAVLPLCCWDYHDDPARFENWIGDLEARGARLFNPPAMLRWNLRKTYLLEMAEAGLAVPRTFHLPDANHRAVEERMQQEGWQSAVLKPASGQSGHGVRKVERADNTWPVDAVKRDALLQEFQPDISDLGETTLTFIDGVFSHAVRRILKAGEWRANEQHGITPERVDVSPEVIAAASRYLALLPETPLYARVDGLARADGFMLMELELIEPYLYCEFAPGSAENFAAAFARRLNRQSPSQAVSGSRS
ncbi:ATP-grasp domain-containing protein [Microvirga terricola]|uniref:Glutathione synthetase n=1 Tax=Microvirga terricola TaxID=2719797 RepID=A0ABX0V6Y8_9HYPH|nr:glutathione synthetase [Microvirga terricola]NIX75508.1 glutathione synthetase [Microvirga terricola]